MKYSKFIKIKMQHSFQDFNLNNFFTYFTFNPGKRYADLENISQFADKSKELYHYIAQNFKMYQSNVIFLQQSII